MRYNQQLNFQKRRSFLLRVRLFILCMALLIFAAGAYAYYSVVSRQSSNTNSTSTSRQTSGYFAASVKVFNSSFFQFQADKTWAEVPAESTPTKFVYRSHRANLIEHELTIYVNEIPPALAANRVLPVNLKGDSELLPISVSEHCLKTAGAPTGDNPVVELDRVKLACDSDSTNYTVLVGLAGGNTVLDLLRPDNTRAKYSIAYSNLKATPDATQLNQIAETFQTR